jgi:hypothetical protein
LEGFIEQIIFKGPGSSLTEMSRIMNLRD